MKSSLVSMAPWSPTGRPRHGLSTTLPTVRASFPRMSALPHFLQDTTLPLVAHLGHAAHLECVLSLVLNHLLRPLPDTTPPAAPKQVEWRTVVLPCRGPALPRSCCAVVLPTLSCVQWDGGRG